MSFEFNLKKLYSLLFLAKTQVSTKRRVWDLFGVEFVLFFIVLGPETSTTTERNGEPYDGVRRTQQRQEHRFKTEEQEKEVYQPPVFIGATADLTELWRGSCENPNASSATWMSVTGQCHLYLYFSRVADSVSLSTWFSCYNSCSCRTMDDNNNGNVSVVYTRIIKPAQRWVKSKILFWSD